MDCLLRGVLREYQVNDGFDFTANVAISILAEMTLSASHSHRRHSDAWLSTTPGTDLCCMLSSPHDKCTSIRDKARLSPDLLGVVTHAQRQINSRGMATSSDLITSPTDGQYRRLSDMSIQAVLVDNSTERTGNTNAFFLDLQVALDVNGCAS